MGGFGMDSFLTTTPLVTGVLISVAVYVLIVSLLPKRLIFESTRYTRNQLKRLSQQDDGAQDALSDSILRDQGRPTGLLANAFYALPFTKAAQERIAGAGLASAIDRIFIIGLIAFIFVLFAMKHQGWVSIVCAVAAGYGAAYWYINRHYKKRAKSFLDQFPDALDMVVRSVRSGFPLNAAVNMVADTMTSPAKEEFKQISDEVAYGSTLVDAMNRLSVRMGAPDVRFFVVVLALQQDVGGNLAEVLENLSGLIRRRKTLRLKIHALTAEGTATMWVLSSLPFFIFSILWFMSPQHLEPFFTMGSGKILLGVAIGLILTGITVIKRMINLEV